MSRRLGIGHWLPGSRSRVSMKCPPPVNALSTIPMRGPLTSGCSGSNGSETSRRWTDRSRHGARGSGKRWRLRRLCQANNDARACGDEEAPRASPCDSRHECAGNGISEWTSEIVSELREQSGTPAPRSGASASAPPDVSPPICEWVPKHRRRRVNGRRSPIRRRASRRR